ncbi:hypothetical protein ACHAXR_010108 [Thalassiosira sp. AJA248-18]
MEPITQFVSKLLAQIRKEITSRRGRDENKLKVSSQSTTFSGNEGPQKNLLRLPSTSSFTFSKRKCERNASTKQVPSAINCSSPSATPPRHRKQSSHNGQQITPSSQQPSFFVSNSPKSKPANFRSRAKLAKASIRARSGAAISRQREQERHERTRQALEQQSNWRMERDKSKKQRELLLEEDREKRRQQWKERKEREKQVRSSMHAAAEEAKSMALDAGCTPSEAIVEAAAAAARVVDDESTLFHSTNSDSDEGSLIDDDCSVEESLQTIEKDSNVSNEIGALPPKNEDDNDVSSVSESENCQYVTAAIAFTPQTHANCSGEAIVATTYAQHETICKSTETDINFSTKEMAAPCSSGESSSLSDPKIPIEASSTPLSSRKANDEDTKPVESICIDYALNNDAPSWQNEKQLHILNGETTSPPPAVLDDEDSTSIHSKSNAPMRRQNEKQLHESVDEKVLREKAKSTKTTAGSGRKFCNLFPSFSDIFANLVNGQRQKRSADVRQRELSKSMEYQIEQYTRMSTSFTTCLQLEEDDSSDDCSSDTDHDSFNQGLFYRINSRRPDITSIIRKSFSHHRLSSWTELPPDTEDTCWNLQWVWGLPKASDFDNLLVFQKINRFRNTRGLTRKDLLKKNIQQFSNRATDGTGDYNIMPLSYSLPHEYNSFVSGYQSIQKISGDKAANIWILKPVGLSRGRGISLVNDIADVSYSQPIVIQRYVADPMKFMNFKFDLRMYVLVTSFSPLEAFIYKEGLARFGSRQYSLRPEFLNDHRIHLTNSSIQREFNDTIDRSHPSYLAGRDGSGNKVAFSWLWKRLEGLGMNTETLWLQIVDVCRKALEASGSDIPHQPNSFELFGFDVMFDEHQKAWLIEVNSSPSLGCDSPLDTHIKGGLIRDTIALVDPPVFDRKVLADVCKRRMTHRKSATNSSPENDLAHILKNKLPRKIGDMPKKMVNFERIVPPP